MSAQKRDENTLEFDRQQRLINSIQNSQTWNKPAADRHPSATLQTSRAHKTGRFGATFRNPPVALRLVPCLGLSQRPQGEEVTWGGCRPRGAAHIMQSVTALCIYTRFKHSNDVSEPQSLLLCYNSISTAHTPPQRVWSPQEDICKCFTQHAENTSWLNPGLTFNRILTIFTDAAIRLSRKEKQYQNPDSTRTLFGFRLSLSEEDHNCLCSP